MQYIELAFQKNLTNLSQIHYLKNRCKSKIGQGFKIDNKKEGKGTDILVINGFMNENETDISEWEESLKIIWKDNPYYYLSWDSQTIVDILNPSKISWVDAMKNAEITGELLGKVLATYKNKIILCGHSLGARVIYFALKYLDKQNINSSYIKEIHLLGGAVGSKVSDWRFVKNITTMIVYNYYSYNDAVLKYAYSLGTVFHSEPIGRNCIDDANIKNIDTSNRVDGHSDYKKHLALFYFKNTNQDKKIKITIKHN